MTETIAQLGPAYAARYPALPFAIAVVSNVPASSTAENVGRTCRELRTTDPDALAEVKRRVQAYDAFFRLNGFKCPLPRQLEHAVKDGLPQVPPAVRLLLYLEMSYGALLGLQDLDRVIGTITCDLASAGEGFDGMRGPVTCRADEIILRDNDGIVASYFQGPDKKTSVRDSTTAFLFYGFFAPNCDDNAVTQALLEGLRILSGVDMRDTVKVLHPQGGGDDTLDV
jgi:DNA/RNA-binding domain of Phe-tRNA-synthetase-like protein